MSLSQANSIKIMLKEIENGLRDLAQGRREAGSDSSSSMAIPVAVAEELKT